MVKFMPRFELRSDEPPPAGSNTSKPDLIFKGTTLLELERAWTGARGTRLEGEIFDRVAVYRSAGATRRWLLRSGFYVAEERRYNPRVILAPDPIPLLSRARKFDSLQAAVVWLREGTLLEDAELRSEFEAKLEVVRE